MVLLQLLAAAVGGKDGVLMRPLTTIVTTQQAGLLVAVLGGEPVGLAGYTVTHSEAVLLHIATAQTQPAFECRCP